MAQYSAGFARRDLEVITERSLDFLKNFALLFDLLSERHTLDPYVRNSPNF
jgi:hypothetical protein